MKNLSPILAMSLAVFGCHRPDPKPTAPPYLGRGLQALFTIAARPENQPKRTNGALFSLPATTYNTSTGLLVLGGEMRIIVGTNVPPVEPPFVSVCSTNPITYVASGGETLGAVTYSNVIFRPRSK